MKISHALARMEKRLQKLVEDSLDGIFTTTDLQKTLSHELLAALEREARPSSDGDILAPDQFTVFLPPETAQQLASHPNRLDELTQSLTDALEDFAREAGYIFAERPSIRIVTDSSVLGSANPVDTPGSNQPVKPSIVAAFKFQETTQTATLGIAARPLEGAPAGSDSQQAFRAFLIVNGVEIFPLAGLQSGGVINIGRMEGNQLLLEDSRVSRTHAQLRIIQGRYMLFDLASTYGTFVNGLRVNSHELKAGDVISFGGVPVVFGLEELAGGLAEPQED